MDIALKPGQVVNKAYLNDTVAESDIKRFRAALAKLLRDINPSETEEHNKTFAEIFLRESFYNKNYTVNTKQKTDAAIFENQSDGKLIPVVLIEVKGPGRPDMVSNADLNQKALHELVLYYLREEIREGNTDVKHLIITDCYQWFVFEKKLFYQLFAKNKSFVKKVLEADKTENTDYIYKQIIKPEIERVKHRLQYIYFDLKKFQSKISDDSIMEKRDFIALYKFLSPVHLLRMPYAFDHNKLNKDFYRELLYIMGVEEVKDKNTQKIEIKRLGKSRQGYSLLEQTIIQLEDYNIGNDNAIFDVALGLVLTWTNRILFLKLLEAQLINFNVKDIKKFLCIQRLADYDKVHKLFMTVLAKSYEERTEEVKSLFSDIPYLNSSLFEMSPLEKKYIKIGNLEMGEMELLSSTVLKDEKGKRKNGKIGTLEYLFTFLDAYDFGTSSKKSSNNQIRTESKTIINAAVLGLIFEKINGYKDGSFFTPGFITEYICRKTLRRAIVDKFNDLKQWECQDFEDLKEHIDYRKREVRNEANAIINELKICDPAVGSGHFLVSALNELIAIKSELGILQDNSAEPKRIMDYDIVIEDDELVMADEDGECFCYDPSNTASQRIQQTLFEEKRTIIENCLFGVDLNPKSVEICQLRLWIELLKNAYFYRNEAGERVLQTLPNIDINIKCGNSLASKYPLCVGKTVLNTKDLKSDIKSYKVNVWEYKNCKSKAVKQRINNDILNIKRKLHEGIQLDLFNEALTEQEEVYRQSMEWMIEFPELLSDKGVFVGFDVIIGNPPYISLEQKSINKASKVYKQMKRLDEKNRQVTLYNTFHSQGDVYTLFIERGLQLLKPKGHLSCILPNKWMKAGYGQSLRKLFLEENLVHLIDFGNNQIFDDATTYTCIIRMTKEKSKGNIYSSTLSKVDPASLALDIEENRDIFPVQKLNNGIWYISSLLSFEYIEKNRKEMSCLGEIITGEAYRGILTGLSKAFNDIQKEIGDELLSKDDKNKEIVLPYLKGKGLRSFDKSDSNSYIILIPKGFTLTAMGIDIEQHEKPSEKEAWEWFSKNYSIIAEWLKPFASQGRKRGDKGDYWWELRACDYYDKFKECKIFYQVFQVKPCFVYSENEIYCNNSMWFIPVADKALFALLNSDVCWWLISEYCPRIQNGHQLIWDNFKQIPIPQNLPPRLAELADEIMEATANKDESTKKLLWEELNGIACDLYGVTKDELCRMLK